MRTTVTLDKDVERLLRDAAHRSRRSLKETLNTVLRAGLARKGGTSKPRRFIVRANPMGLRAVIDPAGLNKLADDLEIEALIEKTRRLTHK